MIMILMCTVMAVSQAVNGSTGGGSYLPAAER